MDAPRARSSARTMNGQRPGRREEQRGTTNGEPARSRPRSGREQDREDRRAPTTTVDADIGTRGRLDEALDALEAAQAAQPLVEAGEEALDRRPLPLAASACCRAASVCARTSRLTRAARGSACARPTATVDERRRPRAAAAATPPGALRASSAASCGRARGSRRARRPTRRGPAPAPERDLDLVARTRRGRVRHAARCGSSSAPIRR